MRNRRMMRCLFHIDLCTVLTQSFIGLTKNRIKWFIKDFDSKGMAWNHHNDAFESFNGISLMGCVVQVEWVHVLDTSDSLKYRLRSHALNRKTDLSQIEFTIKNLLTSHF